MPWRVAAAPDGSIYVTDTYNQKIRKVSRDGTVTTLTGSGSIGSTDGSSTVASFYYPFGLAAAFDGALYVADNSNQSVRKVATDGSVTTFAGSGSAGFVNGTGPAASFQSPYGAAVDGQGSVYIADTLNHCIRKISPAGVVTTLAGTGVRGSTDGAAATASFSDPQGVAVDVNGNVYVADTGNNVIRKISPPGLVSTLSGSSSLSTGSADGVGRAASFYSPFDIAVDTNGVLYIADWGNLKIRRISAQ
jgi:sugar lactone lactonase YvrE